MAERSDSTSQTTPLDDYESFIDALLCARPDVSARRIRENRLWPDLPENREINDLVGTLTDGQRETLAKLLQDARDGGIHDALAYLGDEINLAGLRLVRNGRELPVEPFGTALHYDWTCRKNGDPWPHGRERQPDA